MKKIAVVIPCFNEYDSLPYTIKALDDIRKKIAREYELDFIFVDDGSSDSTLKLLEQESTKNKHVLYRSFSKNAGHQSALRAGINATVSYDATIMMDSDMQHPPELIPDMLDAWEKGATVVQMLRKDNTAETGTIRYWVGRLYYSLINWVSDLKIDYGASDFRLIDNAVTRLVAESKENNLFLRGYFSWIPVAKTTIDYKPNKRVAGQSKYTLKKLIELAYRSVLQFSDKPLRIAASAGFILAAFSFAYGTVLTIVHISGTQTVSGWTSLMVVMLFCFGLTFTILGILGHYLAYLLSIQKQRPEFVVASEKLTRQ